MKFYFVCINKYDLYKLTENLRELIVCFNVLVVNNKQL